MVFCVCQFSPRNVWNKPFCSFLETEMTRHGGIQFVVIMFMDRIHSWILLYIWMKYILEYLYTFQWNVREIGFVFAYTTNGMSCVFATPWFYRLNAGKAYHDWNSYTVWCWIKYYSIQFVCLIIFLNLLYDFGVKDKTFIINNKCV